MMKKLSEKSWSFEKLECVSNKNRLLDWEKVGLKNLGWPWKCDQKSDPQSSKSPTTPLKKQFWP